MTEHRPTPPGGRAVLSLQRLRADHGPAVLAFEQENRAWFASSVSDRGDAWFQGFDAHLAALMAESVGGRGVATAALRGLCAVATDLGLHTLVAAAADTNAASQHVLLGAGFVDIGRADPTEVGGRPGRRFRRGLIT